MLKHAKTLLLTLLVKWKESEFCKIIAEKHEVSEKSVFLYGVASGELAFINLNDESPLRISRKGTLSSPHYKLSFKEAVTSFFKTKSGSKQV